MQETVVDNLAERATAATPFAPAAWWCAFLLLWSTTLRAADAVSDLDYYEKTLQEAKLGTDGPALLKFFRDRTLSERDRTRLAETVRLLGADSFQARKRAFRDLLVAGRPARPFLQEALKDPDPEIVRSAERLLKSIDSGSDAALAMAAARVLAARKPDGAVPVLLGYLPLADEEHVQQAVAEALAAVGIREGKIHPDLTTALRAKGPAQRWAAVFVYSKGGPKERKALKALVTDVDARVRLQAARTLVQAGEKSAVSALITLVGDDGEALAWQAEYLLYRIAGDKPPATPGTNDKASRAKSQKMWEDWWKDNSSTADLAKLKLGQGLRGLTVIVEHDGAGKDNQGRIWECGRDGKVRWELNTGLGGPLDIHVLPNGRFLVAEYIKRRVTERDNKGNVVWEKACNNSVLTCQRLANGNTLIATMSEILEVTRAGKTVFSYNKPAVYYAEKLRDGHIIYTTATQVVEMDAAGKEIRAINLNGMAWGSVEKLPNGRYLVGLYGANRVVEVDATGKVFWECNVSTPTRATRLPNGNTLVSSSDGRRVVEFDRNKKEVWSQKATGRVWRVRSY